jgi:hypothetical protein
MAQGRFVVLILQVPDLKKDTQLRDALKHCNVRHPLKARGCNLFDFHKAGRRAYEDQAAFSPVADKTHPLS